MKRLAMRAAMVLALLLMPGLAQAQEAVGDWIGTLQVSAVKLRLAVHIRRDANGALEGTLDSLDQNANGLPLAAVTAAADTLAFTVPVINGSYSAKWDAAAGQWVGEWRQAGMGLPLILAPGGPAPLPASAPPALPANWQIPADAEIAALIDARIANRPGEGIVVGVIDASGRRIVARGPAGGPAFDGKTLFEIGSMTKVFTGLVLADMVEHGEVALDDPAANYLPAGATLPERGGRRITLIDLATHRSGLPRLPGNLPMHDPKDPYADYTFEMLYAFLSGYRLPRDIGSEYEYSNLAVGLLGNLLAHRAGTDYATLVARRVIGPLGMKDTVLTLSPEQEKRFATPRDEFLRPTSRWALSVLAGAGALRSDADDLLTFLAANMGLIPTPLAPAMAAMRVPHGQGPTPATNVGIIWNLMKTSNGDIVFHGGGTGGFRTEMAFDPAHQRGVVVLTNAAVEPSAEDLAIHLLVGSPVRPAGTVPPAPREHKEITLSPADLDRLVGSYRMTPQLTIVITRDGGQLMAQLTGQAAYPIFAEGPRDFFWKVVDAQLSFTVDASGAVTGAVLHQNGRDLPGQRIAP